MPEINTVLERRDKERYEKFQTSKALRARKIAMRCEYFLPYFESITPEEDTELLGYLFDYPVLQTCQRLTH